MNPYIIFILITLGSMAIVGAGCYYCLTYGDVIDLEIHV